MTKIALLIGVSQYQSDLAPLPKATKDVQAMQKVLQNPDIAGFERVKPLIDPDTQTMREEIEVIFSELQKEDLVLLFFSGHGIKDEGSKLYFATNNTRKNEKGKLIWSTAVAASFIQNLMSQSRCKHQVVILDCCFSGAFAAGMTAKDIGNVDIKTQLGGEGRAVLTSSTSTQYSFEQQESDLSIYSRYIVEGIATGAADLDSDGWIEVQELHEYAKGKVQETAPAMKPEIYAVKEGFKIRIAKALITEPKLKYRKEVERYASRADIPAYGRIILDTLREQLHLSPEEAAAVEDKVLQPYRERLEHLRRYREAFNAAIKDEYPLGEATKDDLKHFQGMLGLRDEDIQPIEEDVTDQFRQQADAHQQNLIQYRQSFSQAVEQKFPLSESSRRQLRNLQQSLQLTDEEVSQIEQPIIAQKEAEERQRQEAERIRQQQEAEKLQRQREEAERLRKQQEAEYRQKLQQYKQELIKIVEREFPLSEASNSRLMEFQQSLQLTDEEVLQIKQTIIAQKEAEQLRQQLSRKQFLKWAGLGSAGLVTAVVAREIFKEEQPSTSLDSFKFETVTVDQKGEIVERDSNKQAKFFKEDLGNSVNLEMVYIPGGKFLMGTEDEEIERLVKKFGWEYFRREKPQHEVTVQPFFMGKFQITQKQWRVIASLPKIERDLEPDPSHFKGNDLPVEKVSWEDAEEFCQRLSKQTGKEYRLPSEAEWEYACRAGTTTPFHFGETITSDLANYRGSSTYANEPKGEYREKTIQVGSFPPNAVGLYDMHGNVWEWCQDDFQDNYEGAPKDGSAWLSGKSGIKVRCSIS